MPEYDFVVLGHSHAVAFLDGVTDWRRHLAPPAQVPDDPRYGEAFQGWFSGAFPDEVLKPRVSESGLRSREIIARVIPRDSNLERMVKQKPREDGRVQLTIQPEFMAFLKGLPANVPIASFLHGNEHAKMMMGHLPRYDFLEPEVPGFNLTLDAVPIDAIFIDQIVNSWISVVAPTLIAIRAATGSRLIHVLPPPPREKPLSATHFEKLGAIVREHGFAPDALRLKWYRRYCRVLSAILTSNGCEVLSPPATTLTDDGLLKSSLAEGVTHANAAYGKHLAHALEEKLGSRE